MLGYIDVPIDETLMTGSSVQAMAAIWMNAGPVGVAKVV